MNVLLLSTLYAVATLIFASVIFIKKTWFLVLATLISGLLAAMMILIFETIESFGSQPAPMTPITSTRRDNMSTKIIFYFVGLFSASCISLYIRCMSKSLPQTIQKPAKEELSGNRSLDQSHGHTDEDEPDQY